MSDYSSIQNLQSINTSGLGYTIGSVTFYAFAFVVTVIGLSTVFVLIRGGRSRGLSFAISLVYLLFYVTLVMQGIGILNSLK